MRHAALSLGLLAATCLMAQRPAPPPRPVSQYRDTIARLHSMTSIPITQWRYHAAGLAHGEDPAMDDSSWTPVNLGGGNGRPGRGGSAAAAQGIGWYRASFEVPATAGGKEIRGARLKLIVSFSGDGRVFLNGGLVAQGEGRTLDPIFITDHAAPGQRLFIAVKTPYHLDGGRLQGASLTVEYPEQSDPGLLATEIEAVENVVRAFPDGRPAREQQLDAAVKAIDFASLDRGDQADFTGSIEAANRALAPLHEWVKRYSLRAVGTSHIDMAWEWPWTETVEVVHDTFTSALQLLNEYPNMTYVQSTARQYSWMEQKYPRLFEQIQRRVKEGRWEIVGGMWVEPDLNMPDGESQVRQLLVGKRYFQQKFGVDVKIGWNPDSFGYNWQLPQIYKKAGVDSFVTQKISWNETTVFPYHLFWWQSPDGSRVLTYFPHGYNNRMDPVGISRDVEDLVPNTGFPEVLYLYGVGDHGGGPTRQMLDEEARLELPSTVFPSVVDSTPTTFFADMRKAIEKGTLQPKVWSDELYLEYHRGCYTSQSETKKWIRHDEELMQNAERFSALAFLNGHSYPQREFQSSWEKLLFNQFHDVMPGSGINQVYADAADDLKAVDNQGSRALTGALETLSARVNTSGQGIPVVIYNPLSWQRTDTVTLDLPLGQYEARDSTGAPLPTQAIFKDDTSSQVKLAVLVKDVPPLGYATIHLVRGSDPSRQRERASASDLKVTGTTIENQFLTLKLDPKTGCVTSLAAKASSKESVAPGGCGNLVQAFKDVPRVQDAWEIRFDEDHWELNHPESVNVVEMGPVRALVRIQHKFQNSSITQDLIVYAGVPRVDVETHVDWHEQHILLKAGFPVTVEATKATFEIPYGTIERPTTRNTPAEKAKFEVPALRWGDLSDASHGVSLLNASKYGYDAKDNVIRLSLLRSPSTPTRNEPTDQGPHDFTYSFYPHAGDWKQGTMRQGYELNFPLIPVTAPTHPGPLPAKYSFASIEPANVILTVMKKAEDDDQLIFRFYEFEGKPAEVRIMLPQKATAAAETNLMEKSEKPLSLGANGRAVSLAAGPYEIKTVAVKFAHE